MLLLSPLRSVPNSAWLRSGVLYQDSVKDRVGHVIGDLIGVQSPARDEPTRRPVEHASHRLGEHLRRQGGPEDSLPYPVADYHVEQILIASSRGDDLSVQFAVNDGRILREKNIQLRVMLLERPHDHPHRVAKLDLGTVPAR